MKIFDIGANLGEYTQAWLNKEPDAEVICVEANPQLAKYLDQRFKPKPNVRVLEYAASDESNKTLKLFVNTTGHQIATLSENWVKNSRFRNDGQWIDAFSVKTITVEDLISTFGVPDIIKIDVEGYEKEVIDGLKNFYDCMIQFEWAEEETEGIKKTCERLNQLGYNQFHAKQTDVPYEEVPTEFQSYDDFCKSFYHMLDPNRRDLWGMIFVKK